MIWFQHVSAKDKRAIPFVEAVRTIKFNRPRTLWQLRGSLPVFTESFFFYEGKMFIVISYRFSMHKSQHKLVCIQQMAPAGRSVVLENVLGCTRRQADCPRNAEFEAWSLNSEFLQMKMSIGFAVGMLYCKCTCL